MICWLVRVGRERKSMTLRDSRIRERFVLFCFVVVVVVVVVFVVVVVVVVIVVVCVPCLQDKVRQRSGPRARGETVSNDTRVLDAGVAASHDPRRGDGVCRAAVDESCCDIH